MRNADFDRKRAASQLRAERVSIGRKLAHLVSGWTKYADKYAADPAEFARLETHALVEYLALLIETDDESFRHLYVGEKAKQFFDPSTPLEERKARQQLLLAAEREIFCAALATAPQAQQMIGASFDLIVNALTGSAAAEVKVLFVGDCLILDVISFLTAPALEDGVRLQPTFITSHSASEIRAQISALANARFDVVFYSPFTYSLLSDYGALQRPRSVSNSLKLMAHVSDAVAHGVELFDTLADLFDCPIIAHAPAAILRGDGSVKERAAAALTMPFRRMATRRLGKALRFRAADRNRHGQVVHILEEAEVAGHAGLEAAGRYMFRSDLQHPAAFGAMLAPYYRDILMVVGRMMKRKLIACDLDNTLWDGVIGEGLGVKFLRDRHTPLLALKKRGVVLAINSKNDPAKAAWDAVEGFLSLEDFVSRQINWEPKTLNTRRIAQHLNLKEKDFIFIDDRADERAMVAEQFPGLLALDALDPRSWRLLGLWADLLPARTGADRTEFYRQRDARQAFIAAEAEVSEAERAATFQQLDLTLSVRAAVADDVDRVTELINRTNQFNMTGSRTTKRSIEDLLKKDDAWVLLADAGDRFGAMGTIAALIAEREAGRIVISTFVLSCRVFGYGMEYAILDQVRRLAERDEQIFGPIMETEFNQPCRDVYRHAGFAPTEGGWLLNGSVPALSERAPWLSVKSDLGLLADA